MFTRRVAWKLKLLLVVFSLLGTLVAPALASAAGPTIVSLTFDDNTSDQYAVRSMLADHSLRGTFFVNSNNVGSSPAYLGWSQLSDLAADGNEIGGHTLDHVDLTSVSTDEARRQVCDDRQALASRGFNASTFAYPFGARNPSLYSILQECGYSSARRSWGLCAIGATCPPDQVAETIPPQNIWEIRTIVSLRAWHTLDDIKSTVTRAEDAGGGWVTLVLHHICDGCDPEQGYSVSPATLNALLDWLASRSGQGTHVRTMRDVVGDTTPPTSAISCNGGVCSSWHSSPVSISLSATDAGTAVAAIRYTTDGSDPNASSPLYTGPFSVSATTTVKFRAWDAAGNVEETKTQSVQVDAAAPVSSIACNGAPCSDSTYTSPVAVSLSATDSDSGVAAIRYTTDGSDPNASSSLYSGPFTVSATSTVKFRAWDVAGNVEAVRTQVVQVVSSPTDTTPPTSSIACNSSTCSSGWYASSVSVSLSATDSDSGVAAIRYTTDGSDPNASSSLYSGPFTVSATSTVKFRAWDVAGNVESVKSQLISIDTLAPTIAITSPSDGATVKGNVKIVASTADGESGIASVHFYVDGVLVGTTTSAPWQVPWNTKKFAAGQHVLTAVATDRAGNSRTSAPVTVTVR